jgi:hypothetical protein
MRAPCRKLDESIREGEQMPGNDTLQAPESEAARLLRELDAAEAYEQKLRQVIVSVRDEIAAGHTERALSMLNEALNDIDSQTDVVVPHTES